MVGDPTVPSDPSAPTEPDVAPTDAPVVETPTDSIESTTTTTTSADSMTEEDQQVEDDVVKKGNDKIARIGVAIYIGMAVAVVAVGALVAFFVLRKKK